MPEDDFKESFIASNDIARMPDLPTGLETTQHDVEEEEDEQEAGRRES